MNKGKTHWHEFNPWREKAVYVSVEDLADCLAGKEIMLESGHRAVMDVDFIVSRWNLLGNAIDAYILPSPSGEHQIGIRHGRRPEDYRSLTVYDMEKVSDLLAKHSPDHATASPRP